MPHPLHCPDCNAPLPLDSPQALCPACLMRQALASRTIIDDGEKTPQLPPLSPEEIADKFPGYEILECLGRGGMGVVYKARQKSLNRLVAIKILAPERVGEGRFAERFTIEAELLAKLGHPHIVTIHDFGETGGLFYLVMEFIDGVNLRDLLRDGKLEPAQALAIVPPVCDALQYAHDKGIVHRDIKPENLLLDREGRIKIADFGIAKLIEPVSPVSDRRSSSEEDQPKTAATLNAGTLGYSAPEQTSDPQHVDQRADIYSLGVVLYEMLTGERPNKELVAPSKKVSIDVRLDEIVLRALEKTPELRYQTAGEFRTVLETMVSSPRVEDELVKSDSHSNLPIGSHFSRTAIAGACWLAFIPLHFLFPLIVLPGWKNNALIELLAMLQALLFWTAPLGVTILGWIAVSQIRRSAGKLHGLWLAVFDGLLFPLLAVDAVMILPVMRFFQKADGHGMIPVWFMLLIGLGIFALTASNVLIIRCVWRKVNRVNTGIPPTASRVVAAETSTPLSGTSRMCARNSAPLLSLALGLHGLCLLGILLGLKFLVPNYAEILLGFGVQLPIAAEMVISFSRFVLNGGWLLFPIALAADVLICWLLLKRSSRTPFVLWVLAETLGMVLTAILCGLALSLPMKHLVQAQSGDSPANAVPNFESVTDAARKIIAKYFPDAAITVNEDEFTSTQATREYEIHANSKLGEVAQNAQKQTGPSAEGFVLTVQKLNEPLVSAADTPQFLDRPYWKSYVNSSFDPKTGQGVAVYFDSGARLDPDFTRAMLELLKLDRAGTPPKPAATVPTQPLEDPAWGAPDKGVSVRLRADKAQWTVGEIPSLKMDLRNQGDLDLSALQSQEFGRLEVDGIAYRWTGACRLSLSPFPPGRVYADIPVTLGVEWMQTRDRVEATSPPPLRLAPGRHVIRFAPNIVAHTTSKKIHQEKGIASISNPLEIEILDSKDPATVIPMLWGEAVNGVAVHLQADLTAWTADESPVVAARVRNHGSAALSLSTGPSGNELEVDGKWHAWQPSGNTGLPQNSELAPGAECAIPLTLSGDWQAQSVPLSFTVGQHVIRFAIRSKAADGEEAVRIISNPIRIDIADGIAKRAALVARYLPGHQFRSVRTGPAALEEVLVAPDGSKVNLAAMRKGWGNFPNPDLTAFIKPLRLKIATAAEAQDITRLVMTVLTGDGNMEDRELRAKPSSSGWQVEAVYIGPPAQVLDLRPIELILQDGLLVDVENVETKPAPIILHIHLAADGALIVADQPCPADQLADRIKKLVGWEAVSIKLHADKKTPHRQVQAILDACAAAGIKDIAISAEKP